MVTPQQEPGCGHKEGFRNKYVDPCRATEIRNRKEASPQRAEEVGQSSSMTSCKENPFFQGSQRIPESLTEFSVDVFNRDAGISEAEN